MNLSCIKDILYHIWIEIFFHLGPSYLCNTVIHLTCRLSVLPAKKIFTFVIVIIVPEAFTLSESSHALEDKQTETHITHTQNEYSSTACWHQDNTGSGLSDCLLAFSCADNSFLQIMMETQQNTCLILTPSDTTFQCNGRCLPQISAPLGWVFATLSAFNEVLKYQKWRQGKGNCSETEPWIQSTTQKLLFNQGFIKPKETGGKSQLETTHTRHNRAVSEKACLVGSEPSTLTWKHCFPPVKKQAVLFLGD